MQHDKHCVRYSPTRPLCHVKLNYLCDKKNMQLNMHILNVQQVTCISCYSIAFMQFFMLNKRKQYGKYLTDTNLSKFIWPLLLNSFMSREVTLIIHTVNIACLSNELLLIKQITHSLCKQQTNKQINKICTLSACNGLPLQFSLWK